MVVAEYFCALLCDLREINAEMQQLAETRISQTKHQLGRETPLHGMPNLQWDCSA
jgi:hypothetical protein